MCLWAQAPNTVDPSCVQKCLYTLMYAIYLSTRIVFIYVYVSNFCVQLLTWVLLIIINGKINVNCYYKITWKILKLKYKFCKYRFEDTIID